MLVCLHCTPCLSHLPQIEPTTTSIMPNKSVSFAPGVVPIEGDETKTSSFPRQGTPYPWATTRQRCGSNDSSSANLFDNPHDSFVQYNDHQFISNPEDEESMMMMMMEEGASYNTAATATSWGMACAAVAAARTAVASACVIMQQQQQHEEENADPQQLMLLMPPPPPPAAKYAFLVRKSVLSSVTIDQSIDRLLASTRIPNKSSRFLFFLFYLKLLLQQAHPSSSNEDEAPPADDGDDDEEMGMEGVEAEQEKDGPSDNEIANEDDLAAAEEEAEAARLAAIAAKEEEWKKVTAQLLQQEDAASPYRRNLQVFSKGVARRDKAQQRLIQTFHETQAAYEAHAQTTIGAVVPVHEKIQDKMVRAEQELLQHFGGNHEARQAGMAALQAAHAQWQHQYEGFLARFAGRSSTAAGAGGELSLSPTGGGEENGDDPDDPMILGMPDDDDDPSGTLDDDGKEEDGGAAGKSDDDGEEKENPGVPEPDWDALVDDDPASAGHVQAFRESRDLCQAAMFQFEEACDAIDGELKEILQGAMLRSIEDAYTSMTDALAEKQEEIEYLIVYNHKRRTTLNRSLAERQQQQASMFERLMARVTGAAMGGTAPDGGCFFVRQQEEVPRRPTQRRADSRSTPSAAEVATRSARARSREPKRTVFFSRSPCFDLCVVWLWAVFEVWHKPIMTLVYYHQQRLLSQTKSHVADCRRHRTSSV